MWNAGRSSAFSLAEQFDHHAKLASQFPIVPLRVVYAKSGTQPAACLVRTQDAVIDHMLYWMASPNEEEARYLIAILNSEIGRARGEQYQARGQWGARHFDKVIFNLPIPRFDAGSEIHLALAVAAAEAERVAALIELPENVKFQRARGLVRAALAETGVAQQIDALVATLLDG